MVYTYRNLIFGSVVYTYRNPILLPHSCSGLLNFMPDPPRRQPEKSADPETACPVFVPANLENRPQLCKLQAILS